MSGQWSEEETIIAMEFYFTCPERMHTDSHPKCKEIAGMLARPSGGLDSHIRNIKYALTGGTGRSHASKSIWNLVDQYKDDVPGLKKRAAAIRKKYHWPPLDCGN